MRKLTISFFCVVAFALQVSAISSYPRALVGTLTSRSAFTADANGSTVCIGAGEEDLVFFLDADYVSGSSTCDVKIQQSWNGSNWKDLFSFTQVTTSDTTESVSINLEKTWKCYRAVVDVGASGTPNYNLKVVMTSGSSGR